MKTRSAGMGGKREDVDLLERSDASVSDVFTSREKIFQMSEKNYFVDGNDGQL
jgi:hypothetical protein